MDREEKMGLMVNVGFYLVIQKFSLFLFFLLVMKSKDLLLLRFFSDFFCLFEDIRGDPWVGRE